MHNILPKTAPLLVKNGLLWGGLLGWGVLPHASAQLAFRTAPPMQGLMHARTAPAIAPFTPSRQAVPPPLAIIPIFCRIEHQWAKKLATPVKFRLGSVQYVDWLEGKTRTY